MATMTTQWRVRFRTGFLVCPNPIRQKNGVATSMSISTGLGEMTIFLGPEAVARATT